MSKRKLLYVDDELINQQLFKYNFQKYFDLLLAGSGQEALDIISSEDVSVILTDLKMPGMNGIELTSKIKTQHPDKVCLIVSAYFISEAISMGLDESMIFEYITKPWQRDNVIDILNRAFAVISI
jgi:YesN/AraC family two-component response regulator